jgi:rod shape-determining protein MreD
MRTLDLVVAFLLILTHLIVHVGFGVGAAAPDLFTLALLIIARDTHMAVAALIGLGLGLVEDALGLRSFGAHGLSLALVGALASRTRDLFVGESVMFVATYLFVGKLAADLFHWVAVGAEHRSGFVRAVFLEGGTGALYVAVVGLALMYTTGVLRNTGRAR